MTSPATLRRDQARPWRIALLAYVLALATGTHWPQLRLGDEFPASDKALHFFAFGGLALLLWRAKLVRSRALVVVIAIAWTVADEASQSIPGLGRFAGLDDAIAGVLGVLVVGGWLWALAPAGGETNRARQALGAFAIDELFRQRRTWGLLVAVAIACAVPVGIVWLAAGGALVAKVMRVAMLFAAVAAIYVLFVRWQRVRHRVIARRPCFACGSERAGAAIGPDGRGTCPSCGGALLEAQWRDVTLPSPAATLRIAALPAALAAASAIGLFAGILLLPHAYAWALESNIAPRALPRLVRALAASPSLPRLVDATILLLAAAVAMRLYRHGLARVYAAAERCVACGHDLRGTPAPRGVGRCGECGATFTRPEPAAS